MRISVVCAMAVALSVSSAFSSEGYEQSVEVFEYDRSQPLDVQVVRTDEVEEYGAIVVHLNYTSPVSGRVTALVVAPKGEARPKSRAGIVFLHWGQGDQSEFVWEAALYAGAGAVSILVDAPWNRPDPWKGPGESIVQPDQSRDMYIQNIKDLRRAVDLLLEREDVDAERIAYVGHSFGATQGGVLAGVEKRVKTFVLVAGLPTVADFSATGARKLEEMSAIVKKYLTQAQIDKYVETISPLAPVNFIGHSSPASVFMQFGEYDYWIPKASAERYFEAAGRPKQVRWYLTSHEFTDLGALVDRSSWLEQEIGIASIVPRLMAELARERF